MTSIAKPVTYGAAFTLLCAWAVSRIAGDSFLQMHWGGREFNVAALVFTVLSVCIGGFLGVYVDYLNQRKQGRRAWWSFLGEVIRSHRFGLALCLSPLTVFALFSQWQGEYDDVGFCVFCFQGGFFWEKTLSVFEKTS